MDERQRYHMMKGGFEVVTYHWLVIDYRKRPYQDFYYAGFNQYPKGTSLREIIGENNLRDYSIFRKWFKQLQDEKAISRGELKSDFMLENQPGVENVFIRVSIEGRKVRFDRMYFSEI